MASARKKWFKRGSGVALLLAVVFIGVYYGPLFYGLWQRGFFDRGSAKKQYEGTSIDNLKFMRTALMGYEESEGQFPIAGGWMDAIENRLSTDDLKKGEGMKKLVYPEYEGQAGKYGYAFNDAMSGKYKGDVRDTKAPMVFESTATEKNAHGDPAKLRRPGGLGITMGGQIVR
ncbi:MAG TPA: hypothetical protein VMI31_12230 [Fimbriimonadaceae bacterium]|nr:hypothetical protein [Fimbriimonadaceae bacterium]